MDEVARWLLAHMTSEERQAYLAYRDALHRAFCELNHACSLLRAQWQRPGHSSDPEHLRTCQTIDRIHEQLRALRSALEALEQNALSRIDHGQNRPL